MSSKQSSRKGNKCETKLGIDEHDKDYEVIEPEVERQVISEEVKSLQNILPERQPPENQRQSNTENPSQHNKGAGSALNY